MVQTMKLKTKQWSCSDLAKANLAVHKVKNEYPEDDEAMTDDVLEEQIKAPRPNNNLAVIAIAPWSLTQQASLGSCKAAEVALRKLQSKRSRSFEVGVSQPIVWLRGCMLAEVADSQATEAVPQLQINLVLLPYVKRKCTPMTLDIRRAPRRSRQCGEQL